MSDTPVSFAEAKAKAEQNRDTWSPDDYARAIERIEGQIAETDSTTRRLTNERDGRFGTLPPKRKPPIAPMTPNGARARLTIEEDVLVINTIRTIADANGYTMADAVRWALRQAASNWTHFPSGRPLDMATWQAIQDETT